MIRKLSELKKLPNNPRLCKGDKFDKLVASIEKFGIIEGRPFLLSNRTGELVIIGGNQRYEACKKLGIKEVPTYLIENLTEEEEKEIIIRDNISNGEWDYNILANEWNTEDLIDWGVDINIDFDNIKSNEDREISDKTKNVECPNCQHNFSV